MRDTIEGMDLETEQKDNELEILENVIGLPDSKVLDENNKQDLNETSSQTVIGIRMD